MLAFTSFNVNFLQSSSSSDTVQAASSAALLHSRILSRPILYSKRFFFRGGQVPAVETKIICLEDLDYTLQLGLRFWILILDTMYWVSASLLRRIRLFYAYILLMAQTQAQYDNTRGTWLSQEGCTI